MDVLSKAQTMIAYFHGNKNEFSALMYAADSAVFGRR